MGRVLASFGVRGSLKIAPLSEDPATLASHRTWFMRGPAGGDWIERRVSDVRAHGDTFVASIAGIDSREAAQALRGYEVALPREALAAPADDEIYVADLVGLAVVNREGAALGKVTEVRDSGAHPLLYVTAQDGRLRLIPYVDAVIRAVDRDAATIEVDWGADY